MEGQIQADLKTKMVLVGGPRQVGKTTLALHLLNAPKGSEPPSYFNWDIAAHRRAVLAGEVVPGGEPLVVFDEIHKYARWRNFLKGFYDQYYPRVQALVTGSARLDYYRKGGDSLVGRYHYFRLHPFTLGELSRQRANADDLAMLLKFGGFPEPLLSGSETTWRRWQRERLGRILYDDLRDLERVNEVSLLEVLFDALPSRIGSPLSIQSLREDLQVSHESVSRWLQIFDNIYISFRILPYGSPKIRAVKKEQKLYFWDWSQAPEGGPRFENLVASHLLKYCHWLEDSEGYRMELRYLRDVNGREVDFVLLQNRKPLFAVECKTGEKQASAAAKYFRERTPIKRWFQVHLGQRDFGNDEADVRVLPFAKFVELIGIP